MLFHHSSVPRHNSTPLGELISFTHTQQIPHAALADHAVVFCMIRTDFVGLCFSLTGLTSSSWLLISNSTPLVGRPFLMLSVTTLSRMPGISWHPYQTLWLSSLHVSVRGKFMSLEDTLPEVSEGLESGPPLLSFGSLGEDGRGWRKPSSAPQPDVVYCLLYIYISGKKSILWDIKEGSLMPLYEHENCMVWEEL